MIATEIQAMAWASWSSIFAGSVTVIAISVVMALLGAALGFTVVAPKSDDPTAGLGIAFGVWSFLSVVVSMAGGGFIAGIFAGQRGLEHGFLVWAVVTIVAVFFSGIAVGSAVRVLGVAVKKLGSGSADVAGVIGRGTVEAASFAVAELRDKVDLSLDFDNISDDLKGVLRGTGIDTLQPEYLQEQMREARSALRSALYQLSLNPSDAERIIVNFLKTEESRVECLTRDIDREAVADALADNLAIPRGDAKRIVANALEAYEQGVQKAKDSLAEARAQVHDAKEYLNGLADAARKKADRLAAAAAKAAAVAAAALILAAVISAGAGLCGVRYAPTWSMLQNSYIIE